MTGKLEYKVGNLFDNIPENENIIIAHVVNNELAMGAGFVIPLMKRFPDLKQKYQDFGSLYLKTELLGKVCYYNKDRENLIVANMFAQEGIRYKYGQLHPLKYDALEKCMIDVLIRVKRDNAKIIAPKFGAGLSGGSWLIIEAMIKEFWKELDVTIYVLDSSELPNSW